VFGFRDVRAFVNLCKKHWIGPILGSDGSIHRSIFRFFFIISFIPHKFCKPCLQKVRALLSPLRSDCISRCFLITLLDYSTKVTLTCASPLLSYSLCTNSKIIMRFSTIAVTFAALAAQATLTSSTGSRSFSCEGDVYPCLEVVISDDDPCDGETVEYCLQPKDPPGPNCQSDYDRMNVYVDGDNFDLTNAALPAAACNDDADTGDPITGYACSSDSSKSCTRLDGYPFGTDTNVGARCRNTRAGLCVTVNIDGNGDHAQVVFSVRDDENCADPHEGWTCGAVGSNSCACSSYKSACIYETIDNCPPTGPPTGGAGGGANGDPHFKTWRGQHFDYHCECDLVLLRSSDFGSGSGLDVHIRT
jgi:hypothetical protein